MAARPKITGDEDELLRMQEEFASGKLGPLSTTVVNKRSAENSNQANDNPARKKSLFAQRKEKAKDTTTSTKTSNIEFTNIHILKDIVEKDVISEVFTPKFSADSFPSSFPVDKSILTETGRDKTSLFAKLMKRDASGSSSQEHRPSAILTDGDTNAWGKAVLGEAEAKRISQENADRLENMRKEEILEEQQKLLKTLDPKLVEFLRSRSRNVVEQQTSKKPEMKKVSFQELPIVPEEVKSNQWLHMDVIEEEKFEWMAAPPPPHTVNTSQSFQARFDFQGHLLPYDVDLPVNSALYHHGEEPERAGYTLNELLTLSRSTVTQQKIIALNTLAKILQNYHLGLFDHSFETPFLESLLEAGLLFILRIAIDDPNEAVISAALVAYQNLITADFDEVCLERALLWYRGEEQPALGIAHEQSSAGDQEEEEEMKDHELVRLDVIKTCLRIDSLPRLRYILEVVKPSAPAVLAAVGILLRISRHSRQSAQAVLETPRLMDTLISSFLPLDWTHFFSGKQIADLSNVYGVPLRQVLQLMRVLSSWSRETAQLLAARYSLLKCVACYVAMDTTQLGIPSQEALRLSLESYNTWRVFLHYGIGLEELVDLFPAFMRQLMYFQSQVSIDDSTDGKFSHQLGAALFLLLEKSCRKLDAVHVAPLLSLAQNCAKKWSFQAGRLTSFSDSALNLIAAAVHFIGSCYRLRSAEESSRELEDFCEPFFQSLVPVMNVLSQLLAKYSNLLSRLMCLNRNPASLPAVGAALKGGNPCPVVMPCSPFPLLVAVFKLLRLWTRNATDTCKMVAADVLRNAHLQSYLEELGQAKGQLKGNWFTRYEAHFAFELIQLAKDQVLSATHLAALSLATVFTSGDDGLLQELLKDVVFNQQLVRSQQTVEHSLENLRLTEATYASLLSTAVSSLEKISSFYLQSLFGGAVQKPESLTIASQGQAILPSDWVYLPLLAIYQRQSQPAAEVEHQFVEEVSLTLQLVYILQSSQSDWFRRTLEPAGHYCRLACVFLAGNDLFLNLDVANYFWPVLRSLSSSSNWDFNKPISGIDDFQSFFKQIIDHFESVSYGNPLFGAFLLIPLQQRFDVKLRLLLWGEHPDALRSLVLRVEHLTLPIGYWLEPTETDETLLGKYFMAIKTGVVQKTRNPVVWQIAVHHLRCYAASNPAAPLAANIGHLSI